MSVFDSIKWQFKNNKFNHNIKLNKTNTKIESNNKKLIMKMQLEEFLKTLIKV